MCLKGGVTMNKYNVQHPLFPNMNEYVQIVSQTSEQIILRLEYPDGTIFVFIQSPEEIEMRCNKVLHASEDENGVINIIPDIYSPSSVFVDVI